MNYAIDMDLYYLIFFSFSQEAKCGYSIIIMAVFWITEALPIAVTSLLPIILFPMTGLLYAKDVSSTYINVCEYWLSNMYNNAN